MILAIDTTKTKKAVAIFWPRKIKVKVEWQSNQIDPLEKIDQLLRKKHLNKKSIKYLVANRGPGSFTGVRIGVTLANALSLALKIPVIGAVDKNLDILALARYGYQHRREGSIKKPIRPFYGQEPHITKSKKDVKF